MSLIIPNKNEINVKDLFSTFESKHESNFMDIVKEVNKKLKNAIKHMREQDFWTFSIDGKKDRWTERILKKVKEEYEKVGYSVSIKYDPDDDTSGPYHFCRPTFDVTLALKEHIPCTCVKCIEVKKVGDGEKINVKTSQEKKRKRGEDEDEDEDDK